MNLIGDLQLNTGLGEASRSWLNALMDLNVPLSYTPLEHSNLYTGFANLTIPANVQDNITAPLKLILANPPELASLPLKKQADLLHAEYRIGAWFYELDRLPDTWVPYVQQLHEFWAASHYIATTIGKTGTSALITHVPIPIEVTANPPTVARTAFALPQERYIFLFSFAATSSLARKNPLGVLQAYQRAFAHLPSDQMPVLIIRAHHLNLFPHAERALRQACEQMGAMLISQNLTRQAMNDLLSAADCYVSLHRAEGFGMGMAESMYLGKPVIGTNYSGNTDFMTPANSYLVNYTLKAITEADHTLQPDFVTHYPIGYDWAEPDLDQAAMMMRHVYEQPDEGRAKGVQAAQDIRNYCGPEIVQKILQKRLATIYTAHPQWQFALPIRQVKRDLLNEFDEIVAQAEKLHQRARILNEELLDLQNLLRSTPKSQFPIWRKLMISRAGAPVIAQIEARQAELNEVNAELNHILTGSMRKMLRVIQMHSN